MTTLQEKIYKKAKEQNDLLCKLYEKKLGTTWQFERAKQIGYLDILDLAGIDRTEFNWIF